jgi:predicted deacylase
MASSGPKAENSGTLIVEEHLLQQIERSNFPKAYIVASLNNDELNHVTTFYYLLKTPKEY